MVTFFSYVFFILINILFSPGDGAFNVVKNWPRFCSFQNSGANLTQNETQPSIAGNFCEKEVGSSSSAPPHLIIPIVLFNLLFINLFK